ncbi:MAG: hypothetical protein ABJA71_14710 [Ginsengibacter sp.]
MKTTQVLKAVLIGILAGAAIFFTPFPFRFFFIFFFIFFAFRFFAWGRWRRSYWGSSYGGHHFWNPSYTQRWHSMTDEERKNFMQKMEKELFANANISSEK